MKGISIKKIAAVAAGVALVGTAVAPIVSAQFSLQKSDVFNSNGTPNVKVVVGSDSAPSDGVWAGNIAAAIAEQARVYKSVSVSGSGGGIAPNVTDLSAKLVIGGTQTFDNAKTFKTGETTGASDLNFLVSQKEIDGVTINDSTMPNLVNSSRTIKWNGSNYTRTFKEELGITGDVEFDSDASGGVADLEFYISSDDMNYMLNLGTGIPLYDAPGSANITKSVTKFTDDTTDNIKIPFFGQEYLVRELDHSNGFLRLIQDQGKLTFVEGDVITGLVGKNSLAGQDVSVKVESVTLTGATNDYQAKFVLIDSSGTEVNVYTASTGESLNEQFVGSDGEEALETLVYVDSVAVGASSGVGEVDVTLGTTLVDLYTAKGYPYDSSITNGQYDYKVQFTYDANYLTRIAIYNDQQEWRNSATNDPLYPPASQALSTAGKDGSNEATFLGNVDDGVLGKNFFSVQFLGFESDEPTTQVKLTTNTYGYPVLNYTDAADRIHSIPFVIVLKKSKSSDSFPFDGQTIYYASQYSVDATTVDVNAGLASAKNSSVNGVSMFKDILDADTNILYGWDTVSGTAIVAAAGAFIDVNGFYAKVVSYPDDNTVRLGFDGNITFAKTGVTTTSSASSTSDYLESWTDSAGTTRYSLFYSDANVSDRRAYRGNTVSLLGEDDVAYQYALYADDGSQGGDGDLYLLLDTSTSFDGRFDADLKFYGTDLVEDGMISGNSDGDFGVTLGRGNFLYYWPDQSTDFGGAVSDVYFIATLGAETGGDSSSAADPTTPDFDTNIYINTATGKPPIGTSQKTGLSVYSVDVNINAPYGATATKTDPKMSHYKLDERADTADIPSAAYTEQGTKYELSGGELTLTVPDNARRAIVVVKTEGSTTTTTGGEELVIGEGESATTSAGTEITVAEVTYSASCAADSSSEENTCAATPENYFEPAAVPEQMVFLDNENPSGTLVLVGGHFVNRLSAQVSNIRDVLTASGDGRAPWQDTETGNFVVAGYSGDDTVAAARAFIAAVEGIDMMN